MKTLTALSPATEPPEARGLARDQVRLLVGKAGVHQHLRFDQLDQVLAPGDLLVVNNSATLPAALPVQDEQGRKLLLHLSTRLDPTLWAGELRSSDLSRGPQPRQLVLPDGSLVERGSAYLGSGRLFLYNFDFNHAYLRRWGRPVRYPYVQGRFPLSAYQTMFASRPGSAEMPSAGRAFSRSLVARLKHRKVGLATITLHTGVASLEHDERPYPERFWVPPDTAARLQRARRVVAVGTTVVRALETTGGRAGEGWTDLVLEHSDQIRVVDDLISGFHPPEASHLKMLTALAGDQRLAADYDEAARCGYLSHEFGDLHLLRGARQRLRK